ncbi:MAG: xylulokinase [Betaproteobacteria bacterium]
MYLGIDLGTSEIKLLLLDEAHNVVAVAGESLKVSRPHPLWSEQHPYEWWAALDKAMLRLAAEHGDAMAQVKAIGLSGQMHGAVLLDAAGAVLRPAILWNDGRSADACAALATAVPRLRAITGNLAMPGFTAPKLLWVREHEPEIFARIGCVLLPKDWIRFGLTGARCTDYSDASGTLWLDVGARVWSEAMLSACGLKTGHMPKLIEGRSMAGRLHGDIARRWGLQADIPVAGGAGDNAASAVGIGAVLPGQGFVSLGTSGVIFVCTDRFLSDPVSGVHAFCHALPNRWHQMSVMLSAASALRWATQLTGRKNEAALLAEAEALDPSRRSRAPLFLPYLAGERTPHNDPDAKGVLFGLTHEHGAADIAHAVVEGVSFGLLDGFAALDKSVRSSVKELTLVGGGARSAYWARTLATLLQRPLVVREGSETAGALGAARLAWLAESGDEAQVCRVAPERRRFEPDANTFDAMQPRYEKFRKLYPALRTLFS